MRSLLIVAVNRLRGAWFILLGRPVVAGVYFYGHSLVICSATNVPVLMYNVRIEGYQGQPVTVLSPEELHAIRTARTHLPRIGPTGVPIDRPN